MGRARTVRNHANLIAAVIAPLLVWPWINLEVSDTGGQLGLLVFFLIIPIAEELFFRGLIQGWLLQRVQYQPIMAGFSRANWLTSLAFAGAHLWQHPWWLFPGYFAVSLVLGYFRERYRGIFVPTILHAYYNMGLWSFG